MQAISLTLRTSYFIETIKNARRQLENTNGSSHASKTCKKSKHGETRGKTYVFKSKFACILEASESTRVRMEASLPKYHEDHIAGKGDNSLQHYYLVHKLMPMSQAMKILAAKAAVDKECEKLDKISAWNLTKVRSKKDGDRWSKDVGRYSSFCLADGHLSFEECRIGDKAPKIKRSSCAPRRHCEIWFWILCSIYRTRIISSTNDGSKSHGYHIQIARDAQDKQRTQCLLLPRSKMEDAPKLLKKSRIGMSRHLDSSTTTQKA